MLNSDTGLPEEVGSPPSSVTWTPLSTLASPLRAAASPPGGSPSNSLPQSPYRNFIRPNAFSSPVGSVRLICSHAMRYCALGHQAPGIGSTDSIFVSTCSLGSKHRSYVCFDSRGHSTTLVNRHTVQITVLEFQHCCLPQTCPSVTPAGLLRAEAGWKRGQIDALDLTVRPRAGPAEKQRAGGPSSGEVML